MSDKPSYGGQAVIEGVMMRSPRFFAIACRRMNKEIVVQTEPVKSFMTKVKWLNKPFIRGTLALIDTMMLGMKALMFSTNIAMEDIEEANPPKDKKPAAEAAVKSDKQSKTKTQTINDITIGATMVFAMAIGVGIFVVGPNLLADLLKKWISSSFLFNLAEGGVKFLLFVGYIALISRMKDIRRVFEYHGAEHKVINTFEAGLDLTPENFAKFSTIHPRCGTSFLLFVIVVSIVVHMFLGWTPVWYERVLYRLMFLPLIAGIAYEMIKLAGKYKCSKVLNVLMSPGLMLQRLTTRPPSDDQVEVALKSLEAVMAKEKETP